MARKLTPLEQSRREDYNIAFAATGMDQGTVASRLDVRRECLCKRLNGKMPVTQEALFAMRLVAGLGCPEETLDDLM